MPHPNKRKGDRFEAVLRDALRALGFPWTERTRAGYERDHGDLHLVPGRAVIVQAKSVTRPAWSEWLRDLAAQRANAGADHAVLVVKRPGIVDGGQQLAVMTVADWARLVRAAGYGEPIGAIDDDYRVDPVTSSQADVEGAA